jgi:hypothetical protein
MIEALDRKLAHVLEPRMRLTLVREHVLSCTAEEACALIAEVIVRPPGLQAVGDPLRQVVLELITDTSGAADEASSDEGTLLPYATRREIYAAATRSGDEHVARLLRTAPAILELEEAPRRLPIDLAEIPLGRRRALARGDDRNLLEKLALDPDGLVIANLLRNPRLVELDVVRIAALRPVTSSTLIEVSRSPRWSKSLRVRVALARNPHSPVGLAVKMVATLPLPTLREMCDDPDLHRETRSQIHCEIERRTAGSPERP